MLKSKGAEVVIEKRVLFQEEIYNKMLSPCFFSSEQ